MRKSKNIVIGQKVSSAKVKRAKELRSQMTKEEQILWHHLRANRLNGFHFRRQQIIDGFIADFYCHAAGLIVEIDGKIHDEQVEYDEERDRIISSKGLILLRIKNEEVKQNLESILERIATACGQKT
ncbi:MAG: DUF559 domain-containing protein [Kamptonema sp. SIO1D9]|nr:DUF559 domain-containing protein [Kamptonema sp. SIO1D9]